MKRIARWSTIFLLLCSIIWAGTASAAMIVENNMSALNTLNTINKNQTPQGKDSALERLAKEIGAGIWDNTDLDDPAFQENIKQFGITVLKKDTQPSEAFIGDAIFDHLGDTEFNAPEMNGNLLVLGGLNANLPSGKIDRLYVLSDEDVRLNIGAAADVQELILGASGNVSLNGEGNVRSTIVVDKPMNLDIGIATNLVNLTDDPLPTGDIVLNPGKNALVPGQQLHMGSELKVEKKISLTVRFRLVDQSAKDMQLETADWDSALLTETTVQYTGDSCSMGAVNMMDSIEAAFAEKYPDLQEQYVLLPEMRSADPWSKVYRLNGGESCFAVAENYVYLSREGDVAFPLTDDSTLVAEFPVYVYRYGEQDGRITYRVRISGARPDYFTPSLTLRSGAVASFTFDKERGEWVTQFKRSDFGADERALIHLTGTARRGDGRIPDRNRPRRKAHRYADVDGGHTAHDHRRAERPLGQRPRCRRQRPAVLRRRAGVGHDAARSGLSRHPRFPERPGCFPEYQRGERRGFLPHALRAADLDADGGQALYRHDGHGRRRSDPSHPVHGGIGSVPAADPDSHGLHLPRLDGRGHHRTAENH